ncbi:recombinase family protein [Arthrobacter cheniae]|uniref:recombinase family protein n=1 Tax=Arthrobacter cheniae TaxID=1258888 RepID=UPI001F185AF5|nr:recombinase family protein [Arthrobacter cheniae]
MGRAMLTAMPAFAQLERDQVAERTRAGMAAAAEHGRKACRREVTTNHAKVQRARDLKPRGSRRRTSGRSSGPAAPPCTATSTWSLPTRPEQVRTHIEGHWSFLPLLP